MYVISNLLIRENDRDQLVITDRDGADQEIKRLRLLIAEHERALTDPHIVINVIRSMDEFYEGMAALNGGDNTGLSIGSIDSGAMKSFDFFGTTSIIDEIGMLLSSVWDRIKYSAEDNFRYQVEVAMMAAGFISRVKEAQTEGLISEEQGQRITRTVAKAIETLFRSGAYTEDMDAVREVRASEFLVPKTQLLEYRREDARVEFKTIEVRDSIETSEKGEPLSRVQDMKEPAVTPSAPAAASTPSSPVAQPASSSPAAAADMVHEPIAPIAVAS